MSTPNGKLTPGSSTSTHTWMLPAPASPTYGWFLIPTTVWVSGITAGEKKNTVSFNMATCTRAPNADLAVLQHLLPPAPRKRAQRAKRTTAGLVDVDVDDARPTPAIARRSMMRGKKLRSLAMPCPDRREGDEQVASAGVSASSAALQLTE